MARGLNPKRESFCREYVVDLNATQAAIRAGYSQKTAYSLGQRLLKDVEVQRRVQELMAERSEATRITAESVLKRVNQVADRCMQAEQVLDREGNPTGEYKFDASGANKALELLGKHLGLWIDRVEQKVSQVVELDWQAPIGEDSDAG